MVELRLIRNDEVAFTLSMSDQQVLVGRAPGNDLVLSEAELSWHHAIFWVEAEQLWVRDLGSTNGTTVGGVPINTPTLVPDGGQVMLGGAVRIEARWRCDAPAAHTVKVLEVIGGPIRFPLLSDRFTIGSAPGADLHLPSGPAEAGTLLIYEDGEVWLGVGAEVTRIEEGVPFSLGGLTLRIISTLSHTPTAITESGRYAYRLTVMLNATSFAKVEDLHSGSCSQTHAEHRVALFYVLGRKLLADREAGRRPAAQGWCSDHEIGIGVWGREWHQKQPGNLNVFIHRIRRQLKASGLDPWCLEKHDKMLRIRAQEVTLS